MRINTRIHKKTKKSLAVARIADRTGCQ